MHTHTHTHRIALATLKLLEGDAYHRSQSSIVSRAWRCRTRCCKRAGAQSLKMNRWKTASKYARRYGIENFEKCQQSSIGGHLGIFKLVRLSSSLAHLTDSTFTPKSFDFEIFSLKERVNRFCSGASYYEVHNRGLAVQQNVQESVERSCTKENESQASSREREFRRSEIVKIIKQRCRKSTHGEFRWI